MFTKQFKTNGTRKKEMSYSSYQLSDDDKRWQEDNFMSTSFSACLRWTVLAACKNWPDEWVGHIANVNGHLQRRQSLLKMNFEHKWIAVYFTVHYIRWNVLWNCSFIQIRRIVTKMIIQKHLFRVCTWYLMSPSLELVHVRFELSWNL